MSPFTHGTLGSFPQVDIVCPTIGDGSFLKPYCDEIIAAGAQDRVRIIVISDQRTDHDAMSKAVARAWDAGVNVNCPRLADQVSFMAGLGEPDMFPWNSDGRRNIGYLMSWRDGADIMISIDDDNLPAGDGSWLAEHEVVVIPPVTPDIVSSPCGFWNAFTLLDAGEIMPKPRGYPHRTSGAERVFTTKTTAKCEIAINAGLWLGDPDVDAITRIALHPVSTKLKGSVVLAKGIWAPVDSQNTAIRRDVLPAYCYFEGTYRFADIWQGYFAQACAQHLGHHVRFGTPAADCSVRNDHDLLNDLALEYDGIMMLDEVLEWLTRQELSGSTYAEAYKCLQRKLDAAISGCFFSLRAEDVLRVVERRMDLWLKMIEKLS